MVGIYGNELAISRYFNLSLSHGLSALAASQFHPIFYNCIPQRCN